MSRRGGRAFATITGVGVARDRNVSFAIVEPNLLGFGGHKIMTDRLWYFAAGSNRQGPVSDEQLRDKIASGEIRAETLLWYSGMAEWTKAGDVPGLIAPGARALPPAADGGHHGMPLGTTMRTWPLFGRSLLVMIGDLLIVPAPWVNTGFYRWLVDTIELPNGKKVHFEGKPGDIWYVFVLNALFIYLGQIHGAVFLATLLVSVWFYVMIARWFFANLAWEGQTERLQFKGSYWGMLGWSVLMWLGLIVIVGWAWAQTAMIRWVCRNVEGSSKQLSFVASGWDVLWRTFVFALSCLFIIPIPWTLRWLMSWYISQFHLSERA
jgi:hypothetical protein